jgi:glycosyltransferase EpsF
MQRILHIVGKMDRAGAETMIMNLYRNIDRTQLQFDFLVFADVKGDYDDEIKTLGGIIHKISSGNPIRRMWALRKLLVENPIYTVVHSHTLLSSAFHLTAVKIAGVRYRIAHAHSTNDASNKSLIGKIYKIISIKIIDSIATHYISCGQEASNFLFPNNPKVLFLPNAVDTVAYFKISTLNQDYLNQAFNLPKKCIKIIQVGRLIKVKNHFFSIYLAKKMKEREIDFKMFFVGQGNLEKSIKEYVLRENLSDEIILTGIRTDIPEMMAGADIMLLPSFHEGFPVVMVEAQTIGLPTLVSDKVSSEVDLGLGLVGFNSLDSDLDVWIDRLLAAVHEPKLQKEDFLEILSDKGFDCKENAKMMQNLYNTILQNS